MLRYNKKENHGHMVTDKDINLGYRTNMKDLGWQDQNHGLADEF
jgi:hypothetical protein